MINATRPGRMLLVITMLVSTVVLLIGAFYGVWISAHQSQWTVVAFLLLLIVFWLLTADYSIRQIPRVLLTGEGVWAQFLFRRQFYTWEEILQAGIERRVGRGVPNPDFILLLPGGSPRREKDSFFYLRNRGKILHICAADEIRNFVTEHYGPLDFDPAF